jgi:hypothetical protein
MTVDPRKNIFLNFKLFSFFFGFFMNNNKNKITFKENLENPKLGYYYKGIFVFSYLIEQ